MFVLSVVVAPTFCGRRKLSNAFKSTRTRKSQSQFAKRTLGDVINLKPYLIINDLCKGNNGDRVDIVDVELPNTTDPMNIDDEKEEQDTDVTMTDPETIMRPGTPKPVSTINESLRNRSLSF